MTTVIGNVTAVLADRLLEDASVVVDDAGRIESVARTGPGRGRRGAIDGHGLLLLPGLVDCHSDGLEKEVSPRRQVAFPLDYALQSFEARVRAAGVTTVFHGVAYQERQELERSVERARETYDIISTRRASGRSRVDHRVLYRFDARDDRALEPLFEDLERGRTAGCEVAVVSFEDHTPGQGQYRDRAQFIAAIDPTTLPVGTTPDQRVDELVREAEGLAGVRDENLRRLSHLARGGRVRMLAHDSEGAVDVEASAEAGAVIAEFPVTIEAAVAARSRGMGIVMGAPNALRGHSHSGNVSCRELVAAGLCDAIASDYMPSALLASAFRMATDGVCSLPQAIALVTRGPADLMGLRDRGRLEAGALADLVLVDDRGSWPEVVDVWSHGHHHHHQHHHRNRSEESP